MNIFFVLKKRDIDGGGLELVTAPLTRGDILPGMQNLLMFDVFISFFLHYVFFLVNCCFFYLKVKIVKRFWRRKCVCDCHSTFI